MFGVTWILLGRSSEENISSSMWKQFMVSPAPFPPEFFTNVRWNLFFSLFFPGIERRANTRDSARKLPRRAGSLPADAFAFFVHYGVAEKKNNLLLFWS